MSQPLDVLAIVGSLRRDSYTRRLVQAMGMVTPPQLKVEIAQIGQLPIYNPDLEETPPESWTVWRQRVRRADAILFATPEYNRSIPGVLKNAIDVGSRPYGHSAWLGKPAAVISASPGAIGGFGANHHLRQCLVFLDMPTMQQPEAYISAVDRLFDTSGKITNPSSLDFLAKFMTAFDAWIRRQRAAVAAQ